MSASHFVPTVHCRNCADAKIYVNTIINHPPPSENASTENRDRNKNPESKTCFIDAHKGGRVEIYCGSKKDANLPNANLPMISVEIQKLSSEGTSEIKPMTYVTTVHQNNVSGYEIVVAVSDAERRAIDHIIGAHNVILNSTGKINVGPGAGGNNTVDGSASINISSAIMSTTGRPKK